MFDFITATASRLKVLAGEGRATFLWRRLRRWTNEGAFWFTISVILFAVAVAATMQGIAEVVERERRLRNEGIVLLGTQQVPKRDETRLGIIATVLADANNPTCPKQDHADRSQVLQRALRRLDLRPARPVLPDWPDCKGDRGCAAIRDLRPLDHGHAGLEVDNQTAWSWGPPLGVEGAEHLDGLFIPPFLFAAGQTTLDPGEDDNRFSRTTESAQRTILRNPDLTEAALRGINFVDTIRACQRSSADSALAVVAERIEPTERPEREDGKPGVSRELMCPDWEGLDVVQTYFISEQGIIAEGLRSDRGVTSATVDDELENPLRKWAATSYVEAFETSRSLMEMHESKTYLDYGGFGLVRTFCVPAWGRDRRSPSADSTAERPFSAPFVGVYCADLNVDERELFGLQRSGDRGDEVTQCTVGDPASSLQDLRPGGDDSLVLPGEVRRYESASHEFWTFDFNVREGGRYLRFSSQGTLGSTDLPSSLVQAVDADKVAAASRSIQTLDYRLPTLVERLIPRSIREIVGSPRDANATAHLIKINQSEEGRVRLCLLVPRDLAFSIPSGWLVALPTLLLSLGTLAGGAAGAARARTQVHLAAMLRNIAVGVFELDRQNRVIAANERALELLGCRDIPRIGSMERAETPRHIEDLLNLDLYMLGFKPHIWPPGELAHADDVEYLRRLGYPLRFIARLRHTESLKESSPYVEVTLSAYPSGPFGHRTFGTVRRCNPDTRTTYDTQFREEESWGLKGAVPRYPENLRKIRINQSFEHIRTTSLRGAVASLLAPREARPEDDDR